jgi:WD40 repeat protein
MVTLFLAVCLAGAAALWPAARSPQPAAAAAPSPTPTIPPAAAPLALSSANARQLQLLGSLGLGELQDVEWSPDGRYLAAATSLGIILYDAQTLEQTRVIDLKDACLVDPFSGVCSVIAFSPDGRRLAVARQGKVSVWDIAAGRPVTSLQGEIQGGVWAMAYGPGFIAATGQVGRGLGSQEPQFKLWNALSGRLLQTEENLGIAGHLVDFSPDGELIAYPADPGPQVQSLASGELIRSSWHITAAYDAVFSLDGSHLFLSNWFPFASVETSIWKAEVGGSRLVQVLPGTLCQNLSRSGSFAICYQTDSSSFPGAGGAAVSQVAVFDPADGRLLKKLSLAREISDAAISPDGRRLAAVSRGVLQIVDVGSGQVLKSLGFGSMENLAVSRIQWGEAARTIAAVSTGAGGVQLWDLAARKLLREFQASPGEIAGLAFSPDRRTLAVFDAQDVLRLWDARAGAQAQQYDLSGQSAVGPIVFSPQGDRLASWNNSLAGPFELNLQNASVEQKGRGQIDARNPYNNLYSYSPAGHLQSWMQYTNTLGLLDLSTGQEIRLPYQGDLERSDTLVEAAAVSPDGNFLAAGISGGDLLIWDLRERRLLWTLSGHAPRYGDGWDGAFRRLVFSPQNDLLVSVGWDGMTRLWDIRRGLRLKKLDECCSAAFSPDGRVLVTGGAGRLHVWGLPPWP